MKFYIDSIKNPKKRYNICCLRKNFNDFPSPSTISREEKNLSLIENPQNKKINIEERFLWTPQLNQFFFSFFTFFSIQLILFFFCFSNYSSWTTLRIIWSLRLWHIWQPLRLWPTLPCILTLLESVNYSEERRINSIIWDSTFGRGKNQRSKLDQKLKIK